MDTLGSRDLRAALEFVETAWALAGERAFSRDTLHALGELIPSDSISYDDLDRVHKREIEYVTTDDDHEDDGPFWSWAPDSWHTRRRHQEPVRRTRPTKGQH
jgi:hypothetical protein